MVQATPSMATTTIPQAATSMDHTTIYPPSFNTRCLQVT